jgi:putative membrane protein
MVRPENGMTITWPLVNACLNTGSALCLAAGYGFILRKNVFRHRISMMTAFIFSSIFLVSYLAYHAKVGNIHYQGEGILRTAYFTILTSHTILAAVIVPLILRTLYLAMKGRIEEHRRWAHWTLPLWFYVSVTGIVIYEMLYG